MALPDGVEIGIFIGFIICSAYNIFGVLFTSKFFTSKEFFQVYPEAFSKTGCVAIILWGLAYLSVCTSYRDTPYTILLFVIEKLAYVIIYIMFLRQQSKNPEHSLGAV